MRRKLLEPRAYETEKIGLRMPATDLEDDEIGALISYVLAADTPV